MIPSAYLFHATDKFEGFDGKWSSFYLNIGANNVGDGGQNFRVLVSTSAELIKVPLKSSNWCESDECAAKRGVETFDGRQPRGFEVKSVSVSNEHGQYELPIPYGWPGSHLNESFKPAGTYSFSSVTLSKGGPNTSNLTSQLIAATPSKDYNMGQFGLGITPIDTVGPRSATFLVRFEQADKIPSLSYGYTAGAHYRRDNKGIPGSLVLGGYDSSRFKARSGGPSIPLLQNNTALVNVKGVTYVVDPNDRGKDASLTAGAKMFDAAIDSTFPYIWLPHDLCDKIQERFRLTYDPSYNIYTLNDSSHAYNEGQKASLRFELSASPDTAHNATAIELPYAAFAHSIGPPLYSNTTRYFPLKKSPNGMFVLGRTFLQEAYMIVDYENRNFTVSQVAWQDPMPSPSIASIISKRWMSSTPSSTPSNTPATGLSGGAIAGIVVGILVALGFLGLGAFFHWKKRRAQLYKEDSESDATKTSDLVKYGRVLEPGAELPGSPTPDYYGRETKDGIPYMPELESPPPPVEMHSPPIGTATPATERTDYFTAGGKVPQRRGATRESSGNNTPGTPGVPELAGDDGGFTVNGQHFEVVSPVMSPMQSPVPSHHRGPSDTSLQTNIDEVMAQGAPRKSRSHSPSPERDPASASSTEAQYGDLRPRDESLGISPEPTLDRRPSHTRGLSDVTVRSDSTGISNLTPEEEEKWKKNKDEPMRPLSE